VPTAVHRARRAARRSGAAGEPDARGSFAPIWSVPAAGHAARQSQPLAARARRVSRSSRSTASTRHGPCDLAAVFEFPVDRRAAQARVTITIKAFLRLLADDAHAWSQRKTLEALVDERTWRDRDRPTFELGTNAIRRGAERSSRTGGSAIRPTGHTPRRHVQKPMGTALYFTTWGQPKSVCFA